MTPSEKAIERSFMEYESSNTATLMVLFPKMRPATSIKGRLMWVQVAKAPYDVAGFFHGSGRYIAAEIKETGKPQTSLPIIAPGGKGGGIKYHQLAALVDVHRRGGYAVVVWENGGQWGVMGGSALAEAKREYDLSVAAQRAGYPNTQPGARSLAWARFKPVPMSHDIPLWLPTEKVPIPLVNGLRVLNNPDTDQQSADEGDGGDCPAGLPETEQDDDDAQQG